jgi:hypothetical protein
MRRTTVLLIVNLVLIVVIGALVAEEYSLLSSKGSTSAYTNPINTGAKNGQFTDWELQTWSGIKDRLAVVNTDSDFSDPSHRVLQWISMRNSSSASWDNYYQKSMEWLCFWEGQGANGEWEAVVSIYNSPNSTTNFVVEVSRFTWHSLKVTLDGNVKAIFPQVTNDTISLGYTTFSVSA